jgi:hypothetical protein
MTILMDRTRRPPPTAGRDGTGVLENLVGAAQIAWALATPFLRRRRTRWGTTEDERRRALPGDTLVPRPRWQFLHGDPAGGPHPEPAEAGLDVRVTWAFVIEPLDARTSRLYSRSRTTPGPGLVQELSYGPWLVEPISFVMDRKMLQGVKWRAERAFAGAGGGETPTH